jgi:glycerol-3-phosphate dehydrogenase
VSDFSFLNRKEIVSNLASQPFDLIIIGGGITGAGIALDAASRGLKTAMVEKNDFAFGTSSRSTKLIHGGLRYLKQLEFGLVKEVGSERAVVHRLARHLVVPEKMLLPLSEKRGMGYWLTSIGLMIYDWLAGVKTEDRRLMLTKQQTLKCEPLLRKDDVKGGALYAEYRTDDARLTIEIVKCAVAHGAVVLSYAEVTDFVYKYDQVAGIKVNDLISGNELTIHGKAIVSAAGPWVDELREINKSKTGKRLHLTKGVHIVVAHSRFPVRQAIYFNVDDGRMIFAIPRGRITYIGTTDTNYEGDKDRVFTSQEDAQYLIAAVNANFPSIKLSIDDIESSWAGLRPLIHEEGKSASELSRKDEIFESPSGLISIAGGKLTGYRKMAERVVNLVIKSHFDDRKLQPCRTDQIKLAGAGFASVKEVKKFTEHVAAKFREMGLPNASSYLVENFGKQSDEILKIAESLDKVQPDVRLLSALLLYCTHHEMICRVQDFLVRRTGLIYFDIHQVEKWKNEIVNQCATLLGWDSVKIALELKELDALISSQRNFR